MKRPGPATVLPVLTVALLSACAATPGPVSEKLDPDTATTVTTLSRPIELFAQDLRSEETDRFAYLAPFETNRMGERALYLWVSAPAPAPGTATAATAAEPVGEPQVMCNGSPIELQPVSAGEGPPQKAGLAQLSLSHPPYEAPVPWSPQWYFKLQPEALKCLAEAKDISLQTHPADGDGKRFATDRRNLASLDAFSRR
ncbi:MAG TPA: hypothetical protein VLX90_09440 [Steroidobacteraceae bacterium]|nr:hypothetical protein [Steroidobacteraceae bacterium]